MEKYLKYFTPTLVNIWERNLMIDVLYAKDESFEFMISTYSTNGSLQGEITMNNLLKD